MDPVSRIRASIEGLAHFIWVQRGRPEGSADEDWFLAEALLDRRICQWPSAPREPSLFAFGIERRTR